MTAQDDINAAAAAITAVASDLASLLGILTGQLDTLGTVLTLIQDEITQLRGMGVDTSGLVTAVGQLSTAGLDTAVANLAPIVTGLQSLTTPSPD